MENKKESGFISGKTLMEMDVKELPYLVEGLIPKTGLFAIFGSSDTGKSSWLRQLAISICTGREEFLDFKINSTHKRVVYISTEDDSNAMASLIHKYSDEVKPEDLENLHFLFNSEGYLSKIDKLLSQSPADLVIVDAFGDVFPGNIIAVNEVRRYLDLYKNISEKHDCAIIFMHHSGKRTQDLLPSKDNMIGSQGIEGKARLLLELRRDQTDINIRHLCIVKGNYIKDEEKLTSHKLTFNNMKFKGTGVRVPFGQLVPTEVKSKFSDNLVSRICELKKNFGYRAIADILKKEGHKISKSTIGNIAQDCECEGDDDIKITIDPGET